FHYAHRFMANNIIFLKVWYHSMNKMQVGTANRSTCKADDDIIWLLNSGSFYIFDYYIFNSLIGDCFHHLTPFLRLFWWCREQSFSVVVVWEKVQCSYFYCILS